MDGRTTMTGDGQLENGLGAAPSAPSGAGAAAGRPGSQVDPQRYTNAHDDARCTPYHILRAPVCISSTRSACVGVCVCARLGRIVGVCCCRISTTTYNLHRCLGHAHAHVTAYTHTRWKSASGFLFVFMPRSLALGVISTPR